MRRLVAAFAAALLASAPALADVMPNPYGLTGSTRTTGTIASGTVSQSLIGANNGRKAFCVQNPSSATESLWLDFGTRAASIGSSIEIQKGTAFCMGGQGVWLGAMTVNATTSSHAYSMFEWE